VVSIVPKAKLKPSTAYTYEAKNLKAAATLPEHGGEAIPDFTGHFTTVAFGMSSITERNALFSALTGHASTALRTHNIDRVATVTPFLLHDKALSVNFNSVPGNPGPTTVKLQEAKSDGT